MIWRAVAVVSVAGAVFFGVPAVATNSLSLGLYAAGFAALTVHLWRKGASR